MSNQEIEFREVTIADARSILEWRNSPEISAASKTQEKIKLSDHLQWVERTIENPLQEFQLAIVGNAPVGVVRFDCEGTTAHISIYKVPGGPIVRGFIGKACQWFFRKNSFAEKIIAEILNENEISVKAHERAGFVKVGETFELKRLHEKAR